MQRPRCRAGKSAGHFAAELTALWNEPERTQPAVWPINMRIGRV
jgi:hypothetical protein